MRQQGQKSQEYQQNASQANRKKAGETQVDAES